MSVPKRYTGYIHDTLELKSPKSLENFISSVTGFCDGNQERNSKRLLLQREKEYSNSKRRTNAPAT